MCGSRNVVLRGTVVAGNAVIAEHVSATTAAKTSERKRSPALREISFVVEPHAKLGLRSRDCPAGLVDECVW
jgi:hypothetical protein